MEYFLVWKPKLCSLQGSWKPTICPFRTVRVCKPCLIKRAVQTFYRLNPGLHLFKSKSSQQKSNIYVTDVLLYFLLSTVGWWWTQFCISLRLWRRWICRWAAIECGSGTMWRMAQVWLLSVFILLSCIKMNQNTFLFFQIHREQWWPNYVWAQRSLIILPSTLRPASPSALKSSGWVCSHTDNHIFKLQDRSELLL